MELRLIILLFLMTVTSSCVSVKQIENAKGIFDAKQLEGRYSNFADNSLNLHYHNLSNIIDFKGQLHDEDDMVFWFIDRYGHSVPYKCQYRLKDGRVLLKNKNFRLTGIPYVLGGYKVNKTALAVNGNGDLLLSAVQVDEGAILFILPASTPKSHFQNVYRKLGNLHTSDERKGRHFTD
ncbi:MAG TPA: hypothetical protein PLA69_09255 [Flavobacterium sp.]|nr:hypothetical protein [Flavobacterium sp.]